jgi:hypothetical protein
LIPLEIVGACDASQCCLRSQALKQEQGSQRLFMVKLNYSTEVSRGGIVRGQNPLKQLATIVLAAFSIFGLWMAMGGRVAAAEQTTIQVLVKDAKTGDPIYQAHLTLRFRQPGGFLKRSEAISYTGKTDKKGRCSFPLVPMGEVTLMVTAPDHNTFGKTFEINKNNQLLEVQLRPPHPVL